MLVLKAGRQVGFGSPKELFDSVKRKTDVPPVSVDSSVQLV
jgi:N-glycosylase/DNA lyase